MIALLPTAARAAPALTIAPITWNVLGLDSNNVAVGPNTFVVGARACNTGSSAATNVASNLVWDSANAFIALLGPSSLSLSTLSAGTCTDFYFNAVVTRNALAYNTARRYHITVQADGLSAISTPTPRELFVEHLVSQNRNQVQAITGPGGIGDPPPTTVYVGQTYTYMLFSSTAPGGYEQLESFLDFPNVIFQILSVATTYTQPVGATNDKIYADACGWQNDPTLANYRSCVGPPNYAGGKAGGNIVTSYVVKIASVGAATVTALIYDFSGSSYHYNNDFGIGVNSTSITALPSADVSIAKSHVGNFTVGSQGTYTLAVSNAGPSDAAGPLTVTDTLPNGLTFVSGTGTGWSCGAAGQAVTCTNPGSLTVGASSAITLTVAVGGPAVPSVTNTASVGSPTHDPDSANNTSSDPTAINRPPVAVDDAAATSIGVPVTIDVKANDSDPDGDPLTVSLVAPPADGSAVVNPDGTITYTPGPGFTGTDTFLYQVCDPSNACSTAQVTVTIPTAAAFEGAAATTTRRGVQLTWRTGYEFENVGFNVWRRANLGGALSRINPSIIAGSALSFGAATQLTAGRAYGWMDEGQTVVPGLAYWIEEIDLKGSSVWHGPFTVGSKGQGARAPAFSSPMLLAPAGSLTRSGSRILPRLAGGPIGSGTLMPWSPGSTQAVKLGVSLEGWYRVSLDSLRKLGLDVSDPGRLHLYAEGHDQAFEIRGRYLEFYGLGLNTTSTDVRVYWVVNGDPGGPRIARSPLSGGFAGAPDFPATVQRQDHFVYFSSLLNGDLGNFFGDLVSPTPALEALAVPHLSTQEGATVEVTLQGVTAGAHQVEVALNGVVLGEMDFDGQSLGVATFPASGLTEGANTVSLSSVGSADLSLVAHVNISYPHTFLADTNQLRFTAAGGSQVSVGGFTTPSVRVVDVTDPAAPVELATKVSGGSHSYSVTLSVPGTDTRTLLAFGAGHVLSPAWSAADQPSSWGTSMQAADMVVVTSQDFTTALEPLVAKRQSQGLKVAVVDVTDAYDEFNYGEADPQAIRDLMSYAVGTWQTPPRFLLLFGLGTYDPRGYLGGAADVVPTRMIDTSRMETGSDSWFTDFNEDGAADLATGRIPVRTPEAAEAYVTKLVGYDAATPSASVLIATDVSDTYDFAAEGAERASEVPQELSVTTIARDGPDSKQALIDAIDAGQTVINYLGHGSVDLWRADWLTSQDAAELSNNDHLSLVLAMTCLNGYAYDPLLPSLGEDLLTSPGGAVAVWGSSGLTDPANQAAIDRSLYALIFDAGSPTGLSSMPVGEAVRQSIQTVTDRDIRVSWILLGDPSMVLR
jgi:uncharacterized repeat protein (TIGR01451 family)